MQSAAAEIILQINGRKSRTTPYIDATTAWTQPTFLRLFMGELSIAM